MPVSKGEIKARVAHMRGLLQTLKVTCSIAEKASDVDDAIEACRFLTTEVSEALADLESALCGQNGEIA